MSFPCTSEEVELYGDVLFTGLRAARYLDDVALRVVPADA